MFNLQILATNGKLYQFTGKGYKEVQTWLKTLYGRAGIVSVQAIRQDKNMGYTLTYDGAFHEIGYQI